MAQSAPYKICFVPKSREEEEEDEKIYKRYREIVSELPTTEGWLGSPLYQYQGFWYGLELGGVGPLAVQDHFKPQPSDILIVSTPKCGSTWLRSVAFAVMNRKAHPPSDQHHPLLLFNSHELVPLIEIHFYSDDVNGNRIPNLDILPSPRLFSTHMPYTSLPQSVAQSETSPKIVYICRNPKDTLVSWWRFSNKVRSNISLEPLKLEKIFKMFCKGMLSCCPFWDHVLGYWKESLERPQNVLFLKYEEMVAEPVLHLKLIAEFMGYPFSSMEEREGVIDQIINLCSFKNLSNLAVNKTGSSYPGISNSVFFGQGKVGDSANCLTPEMTEHLDRLTEQKIHGSGLTL
ncbi:cytosolic sulfotransferase 8-like [Macadamia integrifolia]|uniref:cytosolic sulfotransferase 8-like n=1 Tax=Macadamia integrifolia TaxID=60698 RepID=UPI001C5000D0|nr:cytosolic sulfotransferase 8-like [Macadamia integrifolia]